MNIGLANNNGVLYPFRIKRQSTLLLGKGIGAYETLERFFLNDLYHKRPCVFIAESATVQNISRFFPKRDILLFDPTARTLPFNLLSNATHHPLLADHILSIIRGRTDVQTTRIDKYVRTGVLSLLSFPGGNLTQLRQLLVDKEFRDSVVSFITDSELKDIWDEYDTMTPKERRDTTESTISRLLSFTLDPRIRDTLKTCDNHLMSDSIIVSLNHKELGDNAWLIGQLVMAHLDLLAIDGRVFTLYVDHAEHYPFLSTLVERGTVPTFFTLQSLAHLQERGMERLVPQLVGLRMTSEDAHTLEPEFQLEHNNLHITLPLLPDYRAYIVHRSRTIDLQLYTHRYTAKKYGALLLKEGKLHAG